MLLMQAVVHPRRSEGADLQLSILTNLFMGKLTRFGGRRISAHMG